MINPIQWLRANYARNLADYDLTQSVDEGVTTCTPSEAARILGRSRDPGHEARRRALVDDMRRQQGKPKWAWKNG